MKAREHSIMSDAFGSFIRGVVEETDNSYVDESPLRNCAGADFESYLPLRENCYL